MGSAFILPCLLQVVVKMFVQLVFGKQFFQLFGNFFHNKVAGVFVACNLHIVQGGTLQRAEFFNNKVRQFRYHAVTMKILAVLLSVLCGNKADNANGNGKGSAARKLRLLLLLCFPVQSE